LASHGPPAATAATPWTFSRAGAPGDHPAVATRRSSDPSVSSGTGGTAVLNADGTVTFTPNANFNGVADFSYTVTDGKLASSTATVAGDVAAANDARDAGEDRLAATEDTPGTFSAADLPG